MYFLLTCYLPVIVHFNSIKKDFNNIKKKDKERQNIYFVAGFRIARILTMDILQYSEPELLSPQLGKRLCVPLNRRHKELDCG